VEECLNGDVVLGGNRPRSGWPSLHVGNLGVRARFTKTRDGEGVVLVVLGATHAQAGFRLCVFLRGGDGGFICTLGLELGWFPTRDGEGVRWVRRFGVEDLVVVVVFGRFVFGCAS